MFIFYYINIMKVVTYAIIGALLVGLLGLVVGNGNGYYTKKSQRAEADAVNIPTWGLLGAIIGLIAGGALGNSLIEEEEKEKQKQLEEVVRQKADAERLTLSKERQKIEQEKLNTFHQILGLKEYNTETFKDGRYWIGMTKWVDNRNKTLYTLKTERSNTGEVRTSLNGEYIFNHMAKSANKDFIPAAHKISRKRVFEKLVARYQEDDTITLEQLFQLKT